VVHFTPNEPFVADTPYVFGIIELDEGVRITSRVIGTDPEELRCDMRVKAIFERAKADPTILPLFAVAQEGA
jgi:uncharacterized OB-fold protein